jgi:hypothetical protein
MEEPQKIGKAGPRVRLLDAMILVATIAFVLAESRGPEWMGMLWLWSIHLGIGAVLSAPVVAWGIGRVHWSLLDLLAIFLPFALWFALIAHDVVEAPDAEPRATVSDTMSPCSSSGTPEAGIGALEENR